MHLETKHIDDWQSFIEENDIDLICKKCNGDGCEECTAGSIEPMWNTVWNTGFHSTDVELPIHLPNVFAFEYDDYVWLGLTCCGMDCTPYLALAWMALFPDCDWLPDQFILDGTNLRGGYYETELGKEDAKKIYALIESTIEGERQKLTWLEQDLCEAKK